MPFPPFSIPFLGTGMTIGLDAVIHVLISHGIAIGVVGMILLIERYDHRLDREEWERFSHRLIRLSAIVISTVGAVTGVGIWFITSVLAPRGIGSMLRIFFWPWFIEWGIFVSELLVLLSFYYLWDRLRPQRTSRHTLLSGGYLLLAVISAVLISGILGFMMTSDGWPAGGRFAQAFFNPTFLPQLLLRLGGSFGLGALFTLAYLYFTEGDSPFRRSLSRLCGRVLLGALIVTVLCGWWYFTRVPPTFKVHAISAVMPRAYPKDPRVFEVVNLFAFAVLLVLSLFSQWKTQRLAKALVIPALILAIGFVTEFEFIREFIRGPYLMPGYMYSNQTLVQERPLLAKQGILGTNYWYGARPQKAGAFLFQTNCGACHTLDGANNVLKCVRDRSEDGIYVIIGHTHEMVPWMSPFTGTDHEQRVLANFLYTRSNRLPASATLDDGPATPRPRLDSLSDLPLPKPISPGWIHGLLFTGFSLHLLFVLFTLGTAILGMYYFLRSRWHDTREEPRWEHGILHRFMAVKSLAVVLGIAPLLLIQVGFTVSFFTAINLFGSFWLLIIVLLILAFLAFDIVGQYRRLNPYLGLALGLAGLALLLAVPGIFVGVLIMSENSRSWLPMLQQGGKMPVALSVHWLFRYLHILGAGVVFAAVLHFFQTSRENVRLRASLLRFVLGGLLFQVVVGAMLYLSLPHRPEAITNAGLFFGVAAVLGLIGTQFALRTLPARTAPALLAVILLGMLMTRQLLQWQGMAPVERTATQAVARLQSELAAHREEALAAYQGDQQAVYDQGSTIYRRSCAFCHGANAQGNGSAAAALAILPENLTAIRTTRPYLTRLLAEGIPGTGMPFFSIFTTDKLDLVIDDLNSHYSLLDAPEPVSPPVSPAVKQRARDRYRQSCIACHGQDGRGQTDMLSNLTPPPPDFTQYTLQPDYMLSIITNGYHGTAMSGHANLPVDVRRGLVEIVQEFYRK